MQIHTLWRRSDDQDDDEMPWVIDVVDEYTIDSNDGYPDEYANRKDEDGVRELIIEIPDAAVKKLFMSGKIVGKVIEVEAKPEPEPTGD